MARSALLLVLVAACAAEPPAAQWSTLDVVINTPERPAAKAEWAADRAKTCLPRQSELSLPVYPDVVVYFLEWPKEPPHCDVAAKPGDRRAWLFLLSKHPAQEVRRWYDARLGAFSKHASGDGALYVENLPKGFSGERHWELRDVSRYVLVEAMSPSVALDLGYRSIVEISEPGPRK